MDYTSKYHVACYKMLEISGRIWRLIFFSFASVMVDLVDIFLSSGSLWEQAQLLYKNQSVF